MEDIGAYQSTVTIEAMEVLYGHFPPHVADISFSGVETQLSSDEQIATNLVFMYHQIVSGATKVELFMGCKRTAREEGNCYSKGTIESPLHNTLQFCTHGLDATSSLRERKWVPSTPPPATQFSLPIMQT